MKVPLAAALSLIGACAHDAPPGATTPPPPAPKAGGAPAASPLVPFAVLKAPGPPIDDKPPMPPPGAKVVVRLQLRIDAEGRVKEVSVVESAGQRFDDYAVASMRQTRFDPARGPDGTPVECDLRWRVVFEAEDETPAQAPGGNK